MPNKLMQIKQNLLLSQSSLFGFLILCSLLKPQVVKDNGGVSNFGKYKLTIAFYILGFLLEIILLWIAGNRLAKLSKYFRNYSWLIKFLSVLTLLVFISTFPRFISNIYAMIHDDLGIALYSYEFLISFWLVVATRKWLAGIWLAIESAGSLIGLLSILKIIHLLFVGQFIGTFSFGVFLVYIFPIVIIQTASKLNNES